MVPLIQAGYTLFGSSVEQARQRILRAVRSDQLGACVGSFPSQLLMHAVRQQADRLRIGPQAIAEDVGELRAVAVARKLSDEG